MQYIFHILGILTKRINVYHTKCMYEYVHCTNECDLETNRRRLTTKPIQCTSRHGLWWISQSKKKRRLHWNHQQIVCIVRSHFSSDKGTLIILFMLISQKKWLFCSQFFSYWSLCICLEHIHTDTNRKTKRTSTARSFSCSLKSLQSQWLLFSLSSSLLFLPLSLSLLMCKICATQHFI